MKELGVLSMSLQTNAFLINERCIIFFWSGLIFFCILTLTDVFHFLKKKLILVYLPFCSTAKELSSSHYSILNGS